MPKLSQLGAFRLPFFCLRCHPEGHKYMYDRIYANQGNVPLIEMIIDCARVLDVGCGAGDNARLVKARHPECKVFGITRSPLEAELARQHMEYCWIFDIEGDLPPDLANQTFDTLIFSHVLEHLRDPGTVLARFLALLSNDAQVLIAVPNILSWRMRLQFLFGRFEYTSEGVLDDTHLHFFTFHTADQFLLSGLPSLSVSKIATGAVPLWWLRRYLLPKSWCARIDQWGCRHWPNLFGDHIIIQATSISPRSTMPLK